MSTTRILLTLGALASAAAQPLSQGERDRSMSELHATGKQVVDILASLSPAQLAFKPGPGRWSVAEVAEHLIRTEDFTDAVVRQALSKSPAPGDPKRDATILTVLPDRSRKVQAPEPAQPKGQWTTREALLTEFKSRRDRTIKFVNTTTQNLRAHSAPHPALGNLDTYQWTLFLAGHSARHVLQMREVMADLKFPR